MPLLSLPQTLTPFSLHPIPSKPNPRFPPPAATERGVSFDTGASFFRAESSTARDLAVLAASLHRQSSPTGSLRVLDAMCGCGVRAARYLAQAAADFVLANDACDALRPVILSNLGSVSGESEGRWAVTHCSANRLLTERYLEREYFDLVDVDSFGSDSEHLRSAIMAVRTGGLLYVTCTDGFASGGHRPLSSLSSYGAYVRPMPCSNEVGLRMLIGGALREAANLGFHVSPLFSYYSYHGPVFRVMLQVTRRMPDQNNQSGFSQYGFISYCNLCGSYQAFSWGELGQICCPCRNGGVSRSVVVSGPLWTGPLHKDAYLSEMLKLAREWGWAYAGKKGDDLEKLLNQMIDESDVRLPFGYIKLDEIASRAKINSPPLSTLINTLRKEGYAASRSHIASNAIKTNCPMATCIQIARDLRQA